VVAGVGLAAYPAIHARVQQAEFSIEKKVIDA
jgi:hypothetical protein